MDLYEAVETICKDYCKYPDIESGNRLADICDKCPMNKCEELRWADRKDEQTERIKTLDYCDICNHEGCDNCIANNLDDYCVPSGYEPTTQTETQNSNLTFEKDECAKEYEELGLKELKELIEANRKTENCSEIPNNCETCKHNKLEWYSEVCDGCSKAHSNYEPNDEPSVSEMPTDSEPQTERSE